MVPVSPKFFFPVHKKVGVGDIKNLKTTVSFVSD